MIKRKGQSERLPSTSGSQQLGNGETQVIELLSHQIEDLRAEA